MLNNASIVRTAGPGDEDALFHFLLELHEENGLFPLDPHKSRQAIHDMLNRDSGAFGIVGVIDGSGRIEASIGMTIEPFWYSTVPVLCEKWNYVHPDFRKSQHAKNLLRYAKAIADEGGVVGLNIPFHTGIISTEKTAAKLRLYRRQLPFAGGFFIYNLEASKRFAGDPPAKDFVWDSDNGR